MLKQNLHGSYQEIPRGRSGEWQLNPLVPKGKNKNPPIIALAYFYWLSL